jgi:hypothetical protein
VTFNQYTHPEFGFLSPAPRLRRELRLGFLAGLFGSVIGAAGVIVLSTGDSNYKPTSASPTPPAHAGSEPKAPARGAPAFTRTDMASNSQPQRGSDTRDNTWYADQIADEPSETRSEYSFVPSARQFFPEELKRHRVLPRSKGNAPEIARVPLGHRPILSPPPVAARADDTLSAEASAPQPTVPAQAASVVPAAKQHATETPKAAPLAVAKPQKAVRVLSSRNNDESKDRAVRVSAAGDSPAGKLRDAHARGPSYPHTVFWDWSR